MTEQNRMIIVEGSQEIDRKEIIFNENRRI